MKTTPRLHRSALASALALVLTAPLAVQAQTTPEPANPQATPTEPAPTQDQAQPAQQTPAQKDETKQLERVTVTGSRIKRANIEGPAPVTIITGEQLKAEGFTTVYDALSTLTEAMGTVESDIQWGQHTVNASPLNLRNMGPGHSLFLINGRRVADYPLPYAGKSNFANFNNIPSGAVDRIEVLSSGASAIYGSDAVAGVINVILKTDYSGDELKVRMGTSFRGGRDVYDLSWAGGKTGDNWSVTYAFQAFSRGVLFGGQREFMDSELDVAPGARSPEQRAVGIMPSTGLRLIDANSGQRIAPPAGACDAFGEYFLQERFTYDRNSGTRTSLGSQCSMSAIFRHWTLRNGSKDRSAYAYGTWDFSDDLQGWATFGLWDSEGTSMTFQPANVLLSRTGSTWFDPGITSPENPNGTVISDALRRFGADEFGLDSGGLTHSDELAWDFAVGLRGTVFNDRFDWELSAGRSEYRVEENFPAMLDRKFDEFFLGPQLGTTADGIPIHRLDQNRWWNPVTGDQYRSMSTHGHNVAESWLTQANFNISGDLFEGWAGPIGFAATLEGAKQGYRLRPDPNTLGDDPLYFQTVNTDTGGGERNRYAAGVEFKVPLLKSLTATAAGRYDKYDAVADDAATTWQLGLEWRPIDDLLLRGTYATSFRAPDMHFVYATSSQTLVDVRDLYACATQGDPFKCDEDTNEGDVQDIPAYRFGTPDLKYETGRSWTYGFVWDVRDNLSLSADYWNIELDDEIDDIGRDQVLADELYCRIGRTLGGEPRLTPPSPQLCELQLSRVERGPDPDGSGPQLGPILSVTNGPINRAQRYVSGIDASLRYELRTERYGDFNFSLNYTSLQSLQTRQYAGDPLPETRQNEPRSKARGSVSWQRNKWNAVVYADRIGSVPGQRYGGCIPFSDGFEDQNATDGCHDELTGETTAISWERVGPAITWNTSIGYQFSDKAKVSLYVNNIFDNVGYPSPYRRDWAYFADRIFTPVGREFAVEYTYKFN